MDEIENSIYINQIIIPLDITIHGYHGLKEKCHLGAENAKCAFSKHKKPLHCTSILCHSMGQFSLTLGCRNTAFRKDM